MERNQEEIKQHEARVEKEKKRLDKIFKSIPEDKKRVAQGLIVQAARLRVLLDDAWTDIQQNGDYELFTQSESTPPYERERPIAKLFNSRDNAYQKVIQQLIKLLPDEVEAAVEKEVKGLRGLLDANK
ncbi:hypothetical protein MUA33_05370 [Staphylococcus delphini]|uniref:hypothetical protein n=1 Tax=Staphylococcus delphini TaxID=53344 RepID=UPI0021D0ABF9|nr:hypothetical protein [Staphylococcus delphini]UXS22603.1 hypothetical protein MUA22_05205 [Staphylococcus delphini]UXS30203.1 hypothetical protein MUA33_05370 [Staphylococcus delphini]UXS37876.1 hypothetical protein MUA34_05625 [Staphylococcus delphini]UXS45355.1 hypothetical protein MUA39_05740 [Staphylococcus delphini]UXS58542.1 hypothetical protein MUA44_05195 [Staphylococcus delphini]